VKTPPIQSRPLEVSRGEFISFLSMQRSYPGKGNPEIRLLRYKLPSVLSVRLYSGYTSRRS
jgi:hypothetical protein